MKLTIECEAYEIANLLAGLRDRDIISFKSREKINIDEITKFFDKIYSNLKSVSPKSTRIQGLTEKTPEAPAQTGASNAQQLIQKGRPKKEEILDKKGRILEILKEAEKPLNLPEINDLLGIPEEAHRLRARTAYILTTLKDEGKVKTDKKMVNHTWRNFYSLK